jgi:hypothetical protein
MSNSGKNTKKNKSSKKWYEYPVVDLRRILENSRRKVVKEDVRPRSLLRRAKRFSRRSLCGGGDLWWPEALVSQVDLLGWGPAAALFVRPNDAAATLSLKI